MGLELPAAPGRTPFDRFAKTAVALAIALGVSTGAWILFAMAFGSGTVLSSHLQLHAHVQILGFVGLFVFGAALEALPRVLGLPRPERGMANAVLVGLGGGVFLRAIGQPLAPWAAGRLISLLSGALELGGVYVFVAWALPALAARRTLRDPFSLHILAGTLWASCAAVVSAAESIRLAGHAEAALPAGFVEPLYAVGLYGFGLSFVYGFGSRMVPSFLGLEPPSARRAWAVLIPQTTGALALALAGERREVALAGSILVAASAAVFLAGSGILSPRKGRTGGCAIRVAFGAFALSAAVSASGAVAELAGTTVHKFVWDGARHLYTIGFLTLLILAMSLRLLPAFTGRPLARPRTARAALVLVAASALMRALQIPVALGWGGLPLYRVTGASGVVALAGLIAYAVVLWKRETARAMIASV